MFEHVSVIILADAAIILVYRWGAAVLSMYAVAHLSAKQYVATGLTLVFATYLALLRTPLPWLIWNDGDVQYCTS